ncbi:MAG: PmoA family protein [Mangrovibacterium sp.]
MMRKFMWIILTSLFPVAGFAQEKLEFTVFAGEYNRVNCPVGVDLSSSGLELNNRHYTLYQIEGKKEVSVPAQLEEGKNPRLWFIMSGALKEGGSRKYVLRESEAVSPVQGIVLEKGHAGLKLVRGGNPLLNYQFNEVYPPEGVDPLFKRSGFIHPLWSPAGEVLSRIQAPDHYHHYGIWGPWTKTHIQGREVDFWNLAKGQGTVRFAGFLSQVEGPVYSGFSALQEHVDFGAKGPDQTVIHELLNVRAWNLDPGKKVWLIDYTSIMNCPLDSGILLDAYRYGGGIGFRATEKWNKNNSSVLTSEGNNRAKADGTNARWCRVEGESETGRSGILFMSHPSNRAFPEPMRVWPEDSNGRGDLYFEFCPIRHQDWKLDKGKDYSQKYRLVVFDGELAEAEAEQYWTAFAKPPGVVISY